MSVERRLSRSLHACLKGEEVDGDGDTDGGGGSWDAETGYPHIEDLSGLTLEDLIADEELNGLIF